MAPGALHRSAKVGILELFRGLGDTSHQWQQEVPGLEQVGCSLTPWLEVRPEGQELPVLFSPASSCPHPLGCPP